MENIQSTARRKVGRPSLAGRQKPIMLLRRIHAVWKFKQLRAKGEKFNSAVEETRAYQKKAFGLKKASAAMIKTIIAETLPCEADQEWCVEISTDPVTGNERGALRFVPKKSYIRANNPARNFAK